MKHVVVFTVVLIAIGLGINAHAQTPNSIQTKTYFSSGVFQTSTGYSDGMGKQLQSRLELDATKARIVSNQYDDAGRACMTSVPFSTTTAGYIPGPLIDLWKYDMNYYRVAAPFSEVRYKPDPLGRTDSIGAPGEPFSLYNSLNFKRSWYMGTTIGAANTFIDATGFIKEDVNLTNSWLDGLEGGTYLLSSAPTHFLTVTKGANDDSYTQELKDAFGRTVSVCNMSNLRSESAYDIFGNLRATYPPGDHSRGIDTDFKDTFDYDARGLMTRKKTPDAGEVQYIYDDAGRICCVQNAKQRALHQDTYDEYLVYVYDEIGRNIAIGVNRDKTILFSSAKDHLPWSLDNTQVCIRRIYDDPDQLAAMIGISATDLNTRFSPVTINNTRGRLVAEIAYLIANPGTPENTLFFNNVAIDIYSYDDEGNVAAKLKRIPNLAHFCLFTYTYDLQGNLTAYKYAKNDLNVSPSMDDLSYVHDNLGRIQLINQNNERVIGYRFDDYGRTTQKRFAGTDASPADIVSLTYNIRNWVTAIGSSNGKFSQNLYYNDRINGSTPQYNGNISAATYTYDDASHNGAVDFSYDIVNRLTVVWGITNRTDFPNETISFLPNGRIATKQKGTQPDGVYNYYPNSNRLEKIQGILSKNKSNNYLYDENGNMVLDQSKNMLAEYDWRDMPVRFKFFDKIPVSALSGDINALEARITDPSVADHGSMVSQVKMTYDAGGNRVLKQEYKY